MSDITEVKSKPTGPNAPEAPQSPLALPKETPAPEPKPEAKPTTEPTTEPKQTATDPPEGSTEVTADEINALRSEFAEKGELSQESINKLAGRPIKVTPEMLVQFSRGTAALQTQTINAAYEAVGGKEAFEVQKNWAKANLPEAEQQAFQNAILTGSHEQVVSAVKSLNQKYTEANGTPPTLAGGRKGSSGPTPYGSIQEASRAMADRRYGNDPAYRREVEARMKASHEAGTI